MSVHLDVWLRELSRAGLSPSAQQELLARLASTTDCRARCFPEAPGAYRARVKDLLLSAFLAQKGPCLVVNDSPAASGLISRRRAWELVYLGLPMLGGSRRPPHELHIVLVDVMCMVARNEFPLTVPPSWSAELFEVLSRVASFQMTDNKWSPAASPGMDLDCQAYSAALSKTIENDQRRFRRQ